MTPGGIGPTGDVLSKLTLAEGGTLYLEAIQYLSHDTQRALAELLATLDAHGGAGASQPDVRVVVSTTRTIDEELAAGRIVPELRRRFRVIDLPPLRERLDDLPAVAHHILKRHAEQGGDVVPQLSARSIERCAPTHGPVIFASSGACSRSRPPRTAATSSTSTSTCSTTASKSAATTCSSNWVPAAWRSVARASSAAGQAAAIKLLRLPAGSGGGEDDGRTLRQRFEREAHATAELQSPHTVQLYDFGITDTGRFYYVMERLLGMDLQRMIAGSDRCHRRGRSAFCSRPAIAGRGARARMVHRDIKPANLFVCRLGQEYDFLKVLDFGVVSRNSREPDTYMTTAGLVLGTPAFLAPELAVGDVVFDGRADIYALGCVGFWLLTGHPPFEANDALSMLMHHSKTEPSPPSALAEEPVPAALDASFSAVCRRTRPIGRRMPTCCGSSSTRSASPTVGPPQGSIVVEQHAPELVDVSL
jgi:serine/threonine protein kinase